MSVRRAVVEADVASLNVAGFCRDHGISRESFYAWRRRYALEGEAGLESRSRAPRRVANRTPVEVEDLIVELRKELDDAGLDAGPATISYWLVQRLPPGSVLCSEATIWRVLTRRGFVTPDPSKAPARKWRSFAAERVNECWQMDATHWPLADGTEVEIINCLDDCSRVALRALAVPTATLAGVWDTITDAADRYGWPERVLTDNGRYFGVAFEENLRLLGVGLRHSRPYHPQTCGKAERFQQTEKRWLEAQPPADTIPELQALLDRFVDLYNHQRPHRSLERRTPADVWDTTPKSGPADAPLGCPTTLFRNLVYDGVVWAGPYRITLGVEHNQARATIIITGTRAHVFKDGRLIRELTIHPARENQPLHHRPGRPSR
jgi:transposase InsO family protein